MIDTAMNKSMLQILREALVGATIFYTIPGTSGPAEYVINGLGLPTGSDGADAGSVLLNLSGGATATVRIDTPLLLTGGSGSGGQGEQTQSARPGQ